MANRDEPWLVFAVENLADPFHEQLGIERFAEKVIPADGIDHLRQITLRRP